MDGPRRLLSRQGFLRTGGAALAGALLAGTAGPLAVPPRRVGANTLAFSDTFDTAGKTAFAPPWGWQTKAAPGVGGDPMERLLTVAQPARAGSGALRLHVNDADVSPHTQTENPRAQVEKSDLFAQGSEWYVGCSFYFPTDFPTLRSGHWFIFNSYGFRSPWNGSAPGKYRISPHTPNRIEYGRDERTNHDAIWSVPLVKGQWIDLVTRIKFSTSSKFGFVEIWRNGVKQTFKDGSTTFRYATLKPEQSGAGGLNLSHYRSKGAMASATYYVDQLKVAKTYAEATPP